MFKYPILAALCLLSFSEALAQVNLNSGLVAYYPFNGNFLDASGNGNNGTGIGGVTFVADQWGNPNAAASFDGTSGYVTVPAAASLTTTTHLSIAMRFKSNDGLHHFLASKADWISGPNNIQFQLQYNYDQLGINGLSWGTEHTGSCTTMAFAPSAYSNTGQDIVANEWYCIVVTFDSGIQNVYVNGVLAVHTIISGTAGSPYSIDSCSLGTLRLGTWWSQDPAFFNGTMDEVRIYNRQLDTQEVDSLCDYIPILNNACDTISMQNTIHACKNTTVNLNAVVTGPATMLSTSWLPGTGLSDSTILNPQCVVGATSVNYTLTVKALMQNGDTCTISKSIYVAVSNLNPQIIAAHIHCTKQFNFIAVDSGNSITSYNWNFGDANTATGTSVSHIYNSYGSYNVTLSETDAYGCKDSVEQSVILSPNLNLILNTTHDTLVCSGQNIQLDVSGADSSYIWTPASGLNNPDISDPVASIDSTIKYIVTGFDSGGVCKGIDSVTILFGIPPVITATGDSSICYGQYTQLNAVGAVAYSWYPPDYITNSEIASPLAHPVVPTMYVVTGTGSNGCTNKDSVFVDVRPLPILTVSASGTVSCSDTAVQLSVSGAATYVWSPAGYVVNDDTHSPDPFVSPAANTEFYVTGTDATGCSNTDSVLVVSDKSVAVFMPSAFTPNNDGLNDVIYPKIYCDLILDQFSIYNRWGQRVFTTNTAGEGWDGKVKGVVQTIGTFDYYVKGHKRSNGKSVLYKGSFTLMR